MSNAFHRAIIQLPDTIHFRVLSLCASLNVPSIKKKILLLVLVTFMIVILCVYECVRHLESKG